MTRIGSLFSGIGGLELGLEHATGGRVLWQVEKEKFCRDVLARHWPDAVRFDDVCTVGADLPAVDILCGGFPCQDVSLAGRRAGFGGERSSLWREYRRIAAILRPRFVVVENVPGLLTSRGGHDFAEVLGDLAALGYAARWDVFRASDVGAPHRRERLFVLAYRDGGRCERERVSGVLDGIGETLGHDADGCGGAGVADTGDGRREQCIEDGRSLRGAREDLRGEGRPQATAARSGGQGVGQADPCGERLPLGQGVAGDDGAELAPAVGGRRVGGRRRGDRRAKSRVGGAAPGLPRGLDGHRWPAGRGEEQRPWEAPRTAAGVAQRSQRLRALGNAVVPQVAALAWRVLSARVPA